MLLRFLDCGLFIVKLLSSALTGTQSGIRCVNLGGGGKALTMTMTPWNLTHGQWSKDLTMTTDILESAPWSMVKMVILRSNFVVKLKV